MLCFFCVSLSWGVVCSLEFVPAAGQAGGRAGGRCLLTCDLSCPAAPACCRWPAVVLLVLLCSAAGFAPLAAAAVLGVLTRRGCCYGALRRCCCWRLLQHAVAGHGSVNDMCCSVKRVARLPCLSSSSTSSTAVQLSLRCVVALLLLSQPPACQQPGAVVRCCCACTCWPCVRGVCLEQQAALKRVVRALGSKHTVLMLRCTCRIGAGRLRVVAAFIAKEQRFAAWFFRLLLFI